MKGAGKCQQLRSANGADALTYFAGAIDQEDLGLTLHCDWHCVGVKCAGDSLCNDETKNIMGKRNLT